MDGITWASLPAGFQWEVQAEDWMEGRGEGLGVALAVHLAGGKTFQDYSFSEVRSLHGSLSPGT